MDGLVERIHFPPFSATAGPLQREMHGSYAIHERKAVHPSSMPVGMHPIDDLRQNQLAIARTYDEDSRKARCIVMEDGQQQEAVTLSVRDVRLLTPGGRLKPGCSRVVLLAGCGGSSGDLLVHLCGVQGVVEGLVRRGLVAVRFHAAGEGEGAPAVAQLDQVHEVGLHRLLLLQLWEGPTGGEGGQGGAAAAAERAMAEAWWAPLGLGAWAVALLLPCQRALGMPQRQRQPITTAERQAGQPAAGGVAPTRPSGRLRAPHGIGQSCPAGV